MTDRQTLGKKGEDYAACRLERAGLTIVARNYRCPKGEMDIIARDSGVLVFIEVRTRRTAFRGWGEESVTSSKTGRLRAVAAYYLLNEGYTAWPEMRFDVVAVRWVGEEPQWNWIRAAF